MENFKLLFDTQNCFMLRDGENAAAQYDALEQYVGEIHVKDCDASGSPVPLGRGVTGFPETLEHIRKSGFSGRITLENDYRERPDMLERDLNILRQTFPGREEDYDKSSGLFT